MRHTTRLAQLSATGLVTALVAAASLVAPAWAASEGPSAPDLTPEVSLFDVTVTAVCYAPGSQIPVKVSGVTPGSSLTATSHVGEVSRHANSKGVATFTITAMGLPQQKRAAAGVVIVQGSRAGQHGKVSAAYLIATPQVCATIND
jgi:hypothetical protein